MVIDRQLTTFDLVDPCVPVQGLTAKALSNGPGVSELEGLLALIAHGEERSHGLGRFMPVIEAKVAEGGQPNGFTFTMTTNNIPINVQEAEVMQAQLREAGITMKIKLVDSATARKCWYSPSCVGLL